jgi:hypothetical protein
MSRDKKNIIYTAADIEQYLAGKLSPKQMHTMEKAALDDPFLAEAMEGYEGRQEKDWNNHLVALRQQVSEKGSVAKIIPLHKSTGMWWKIAAAVFVIGAGTALTFVLTNNRSDEKPDQQIAQTIITKNDTGNLKEKAISSPAFDSSQLLAPSFLKEKGTNTITKANGLISQKDPPIKMDDNFVYRPGNAQLYDSVNINKNGSAYLAYNNQPVSSKANVPASVNSNTQSAEALTNATLKSAAKEINNNADMANRQIAAGINKKEQALNNYFTAQVVTADNAPLPFTNISIKKENFGTYTDAKGMVRLVSTDSILNIEVKSIGYLPRTFTLRSNFYQNKIVLAEDKMAFRDMTVIRNKDISLNKKSRRATLLLDSIANAEPADGWDNYNTYLANNMDIPEEMLQKDFHGEVEIGFDVKANGDISNIRINKSLGAAYDDEARRLIMEGPQWKVKKGKKTSARVKVQF